MATGAVDPQTHVTGAVTGTISYGAWAAVVTANAFELVTENHEGIIYFKVAGQTVGTFTGQGQFGGSNTAEGHVAWRKVQLEAE